jgi:hypothetical protein
MMAPSSLHAIVVAKQLTMVVPSLSVDEAVSRSLSQ